MNITPEVSIRVKPKGDIITLALQKLDDIWEDCYYGVSFAT